MPGRNLIGAVLLAALSLPTGDAYSELARPRGFEPLTFVFGGGGAL